MHIFSPARETSGMAGRLRPLARNIPRRDQLAGAPVREALCVIRPDRRLRSRQVRRQCQQLVDLQLIGAALDPDGVELAPGEASPVSATVASEAITVVPKNLLAPSSREARFTVSPITV